MKALIIWVTGLYSVSLIAFLIYIRKTFLQITGEGCVPCINFDQFENSTENDN